MNQDTLKLARAKFRFRVASTELRKVYALRWKEEFSAIWPNLGEDSYEYKTVTFVGSGGTLYVGVPADSAAPGEAYASLAGPDRTDDFTLDPPPYQQGNGEITVARADLLLDLNLDGIFDATDDALEATAPGKILNLAAGTREELRLGLLPHAWREPGTSLHLHASDPAVLRVLDPSGAQIIGPETGDAWTKPVDEITDYVWPASFAVQGVSPGETTLTLTLTDSAGDAVCRDVAQATIIKVDLDIWNGGADLDNGDAAGSQGAQVADDDEESVGAFLQLNWDDDDADGSSGTPVPDLTESGTVSFEDNLAQLMRLGSGEYRELDIHFPAWINQLGHAAVFYRFKAGVEVKEVNLGIDANYELVHSMKTANGPTIQDYTEISDHATAAHWPGCYDPANLSYVDRLHLLKSADAVYALRGSNAYPGGSANDVLVTASGGTATWNGLFTDIQVLRCCGFVEVIYEKPGTYINHVWGKLDSGVWKYAISLYAALHNNQDYTWGYSNNFTPGTQSGHTTPTGNTHTTFQHRQYVVEPAILE